VLVSYPSVTRWRRLGVGGVVWYPSVARWRDPGVGGGGLVPVCGSAVRSGVGRIPYATRRAIRVPAMPALLPPAVPESIPRARRFPYAAPESETGIGRAWLRPVRGSGVGDGYRSCRAAPRTWLRSRKRVSVVPGWAPYAASESETGPVRAGLGPVCGSGVGNGTRPRRAAARTWLESQKRESARPPSRHPTPRPPGRQPPCYAPARPPAHADQHAHPRKTPPADRKH
jgi:hypothetical protein